MLTFLRKIRRSLAESGSAGRYLIYALGEIALVVIGVLIALQINNWKEHWKESEATIWRVIPVGLVCLKLPFLIAAQTTSRFDFQKVHIEIEAEEFISFTAIAQDQEGYLWLGTNNGLIRYDGYSGKVYRNDKGDSTSLGGAQIMDIGSDPIHLLHVDSRGDLWVGTTNDLSRYQAGCDCFSHYYFPTKDKRIQAIAEDKNHNLWVGGQGGGLFKYNWESDEFIPFLNSPDNSISLANDNISALLIDQHNNIWIGLSERGLVRFNPGSGDAKRFLSDPDNPKTLMNNRVSSLLEDQDGQIWVGTAQNALHQYRTGTEDFRRILSDPTHSNYFQPPYSKVFPVDTLQHYPVDILHQNSNGNYWIGAFGIGLNHFDPVTKKLSHYKSSEINRLPSVCYEDKQGQFWLGYSAGGGLYKMDTYARQFTLYPKSKGVQRSSESLTEPGVFWISTLRDGLHRVDTKTGAVSIFQHNSEDENSISRNVVRATYEDREGMIWIGLGSGGNEGGEDGNGGLDRFDPKTGIFKHYSVTRKDTPGFEHTIYSLSPDLKEFLWIDIGKEVLIRFDKSQESFKEYSFPNTTKDSKVWVVAEDGSHFFGASEVNNRILYRYDIEKDTFISFLEGYEVNAVAKGEDESFWLATWGQGLVNFHPRDSSIEVYSEEDGLISNIVLGILPGGKDVYWLSTRRGLSKFDANNKQFSSEGFPRDHFLINNTKSKDGQLLFGGYKGLVAFYPNQVTGNLIPPRIILNRVQIAGETYDLSQENESTINLSYHQNDFIFEYTGIHNSEPAKNKYQYRLAPYNDHWIHVGTERTARYTNLDPGSYTFQVKAANSDGVWTEKPAIVQFIINKPWWQTWWAYTLYLLAGISSIIGYNSWRTYSLLKRQKELEQTVTERTAEVVAQKEVIQKEKERSDELLLNILPSETAEELKQNGAAQAKDYDRVTVLFTDFKGFTMHSERLGAKELVAEIDHCFKAFDQIMEQFGVEKIKTVGDAYLAAAGLPTPNTTNPIDATKAALAIRDFMLDYKNQRASEGREAFEVRIGIHSGPVVAGIVGIKKFAYDIWGDTVNLASRMESSGEVGMVNISQSTYELLKDRPEFKFQPRGKIKAKNKGELEMYFVEKNG